MPPKTLPPQRWTKATRTDKGTVSQPAQKPSVREKLNRYKATAAKQKEAERGEAIKGAEKPKAQKIAQTVHQQPKPKKKKLKPANKSQEGIQAI